MILPSTGVRSSLKSPEKNTVPTGVFIEIAHASAIEWFTRMNSALNTPSFTTSPASTVFRTGFSLNVCSDSLFATIPTVRRVPQTGLFTVFST